MISPVPKVGNASRSVLRQDYPSSYYHCPNKKSRRYNLAKQKEGKGGSEDGLQIKK